MDVTNGKIYTAEELEKYFGSLHKAERDKRFIPMEIPPTQRQMERKPPKVGRNEKCPCGSGKKFKKCHFEEAKFGGVR
jgi:uncharacterized protein